MELPKWAAEQVITARQGSVLLPYYFPDISAFLAGPRLVCCDLFLCHDFSLRSMIRSLYVLVLLLLLPHFSFSRDVQRRAERAYNTAMRRAAEHKWDKAEQAIVKAITLQKNYTQAYITYGGWLLERHQYAAAAAVLKDGEKLCKDGQKIFARPLTKSLLYSGDLGGALGRIPLQSKDTFWRGLAAQAAFMREAVKHADTGKVSPVGPLWGINTPYPELFPLLSADGQTLYLTRRMNGIDEDFFYVKPDTCGGWQSARNMGAPPNTLQQEAAQAI
jgi:hypothetical protein